MKLGMDLCKPLVPKPHTGASTCAQPSQSTWQVRMHETTSAPNVLRRYGIPQAVARAAAHLQPAPDSLTGHPWSTHGDASS